MKLNNIDSSYHCKTIVISLIVYFFISSELKLPNLRKKIEKSKTKM